MGTRRRKVGGLLYAAKVVSSYVDVAMSRWLMDMRRPEKMTHPVALELSYNDVNDGEAKVTGLRIIYRDTVEDLTPKNVEL